MHVCAQGRTCGVCDTDRVSGRRSTGAKVQSPRVAGTQKLKGPEDAAETRSFAEAHRGERLVVPVPSVTVLFPSPDFGFWALHTSF